MCLIVDTAVHHQDIKLENILLAQPVASQTKSANEQQQQQQQPQQQQQQDQQDALAAARSDSGGESIVIKLADFGISINLREERAVTRAGTLDYMVGAAAFERLLGCCAQLAWPALM